MMFTHTYSPALLFMHVQMRSSVRVCVLFYYYLMHFYSRNICLPYNCIMITLWYLYHIYLLFLFIFLCVAQGNKFQALNIKATQEPRLPVQQQHKQRQRQQLIASQRLFVACRRLLRMRLRQDNPVEQQQLKQLLPGKLSPAKLNHFKTWQKLAKIVFIMCNFSLASLWLIERRNIIFCSKLNSFFSYFPRRNKFQLPQKKHSQGIVKNNRIKTRMESVG